MKVLLLAYLHKNSSCAVHEHAFVLRNLSFRILGVLPIINIFDILYVLMNKTRSFTKIKFSSALQVY